MPVDPRLRSADCVRRLGRLATRPSVLGRRRRAHGGVAARFRGLRSFTNDRLRLQCGHLRDRRWISAIRGEVCDKGFDD